MSGREKKKESILQETANLILSQGIQQTSLDDVAKKAGVSKATLYNYFDNKDTLFLEAVERHLDTLVNTLPVVDYSLPTRDLLQTLSLYILRLYSSGGPGRITRLHLSEGLSLPELGERIYQEGPRRYTTMIAEILQTLVEQKRLQIPDPQKAAILLDGLCRDEFFIKSIYQIPYFTNQQELQRMAEEITELLWCSYGMEAEHGV